MSRFLSLSRFFILVLFVSIVTSASASQPAVLASNVPTQVFPATVVPIKRIIYIWTAVGGATQYRLHVYQDSTQILNATYASSVCVSGTCSVRPSIDLANGDYMWRIRAQVDGVWQEFSPWQGFSVSVVVTGFTSPFTSNADGWVIHKGAWNLENSNYFTTVGVASKASTISHINNYSTLTYEARMKRTGCAGCVNVLAIRGNPTLDTVGWWNTEYTFDYTNNGLFSVWRDYYGTYTALKNWTSTTTIVQGGWNTLKVIADGSYLYFYINDTLVWTGYDTAYASGRVGIGMYRNSTSTGDKLYVDWAQLTTSAVYAAEQNALTVADEGQEVPGGDRNMSP